MLVGRGDIYSAVFAWRSDTTCTIFVSLKSVSGDFRLFIGLQLFVGVYVTGYWLTSYQFMVLLVGELSLLCILLIQLFRVIKGEHYNFVPRS